MARKTRKILPGRPRVVLGAEDFERLSALVESMIDRHPEIAGLDEELQRAEVRRETPADVVGMYSLVEFLDESSGERRRAQLVYPAEADIASGRISVLTPVGSALIGLSAGDTIDWPTRTGQVRPITILDVKLPSDAVA